MIRKAFLMTLKPPSQEEYERRHNPVWPELQDVISSYLLFDARIRYEEFAHEKLFFQAIAESGQMRMGNPPWKDLRRYLRNSRCFMSSEWKHR